ncbi:MAG: Wzt carbohydrate-binding domain-containing protein, partial [Bacteroidales bacterium]
KLGHPFNKYRWKDMKSVISSGENDFIIHYATLINDETGENPKLFRGGETIRIGIIAELKSDINRPDIRITLNGQFGTSVWMVYLTHFKPIVRYKKDQPVCISVRIKMPPMGNGLYSLSFNTVDLSGGDLKLIRAYHDAIVFEVAGDEILYKLGTLLVVKDVEIAAKVL